MESMSHMVKEFTSDTIKLMVDKPENVDVQVVTSTKAVLIHVKVAECDCGKVIGRKGRIVEALTNIITSIKRSKFPADRREVSIGVLEDETSGFTYQ